MIKLVIIPEEGIKIEEEIVTEEVLIKERLLPPDTKVAILKEGFVEGPGQRVEISGIPALLHGCVFRNEFNHLILAIGVDEEEMKAVWENSQRCKFLAGKMRCENRKVPISCRKRKEAGECPLEKGIPAGSARDLWGMWLDNGGDKDTSVEDFLKLHLSDMPIDRVMERIHIR